VAGFLDKNDRIVDMVLTGEGKRLLSLGQLGFVYWRAFDDEVDYSPFVSQSGSMTDEQFLAAVEEQIESTPVREATTGYRQHNLLGEDKTNVQNPLFTMPHGQVVLPRADFGDATGSIGISVKQQKIVSVYESKDQSGNIIQSSGPVDSGCRRFDTSVSGREFRLSGFSQDYRPDGFFVRVLESGSHGYSDVPARLAEDNGICFGADLELIGSAG